MMLPGGVNGQPECCRMSRNEKACGGREPRLGHESESERAPASSCLWEASPAQASCPLGDEAGVFGPQRSGLQTQI